MDLYPKPTNSWKYRQITTTADINDVNGDVPRHNLGAITRNITVRSRIRPSTVEEMIVGIGHGLDILDRKMPGWEDHINFQTFDLGDSNYCVCGQLFEDNVDPDVDEDGYAYALRHVMEDWFHTAFPENGESEAPRQASRLGFALPRAVDDGEFAEYEVELSHGTRDESHYDYPGWLEMTEAEIHMMWRLGMAPRLPQMWVFMTEMWKYHVSIRQAVKV